MEEVRRRWRAMGKVGRLEQNQLATLCLVAEASPSSFFINMIKTLLHPEIDEPWHAVSCRVVGSTNMGSHHGQKILRFIEGSGIIAAQSTSSAVNRAAFHLTCQPSGMYKMLRLRSPAGLDGQTRIMTTCDEQAPGKVAATTSCAADVLRRLWMNCRGPSEQEEVTAPTAWQLPDTEVTQHWTPVSLTLVLLRYIAR